LWQDWQIPLDFRFFFNYASLCYEHASCASEHLTELAKAFPHFSQWCIAPSPPAAACARDTNTGALTSAWILLPSSLLQPLSQSLGEQLKAFVYRLRFICHSRDRANPSRRFQPLNV